MRLLRELGEWSLIFIVVVALVAMMLFAGGLALNIFISIIAGRFLEIGLPSLIVLFFLSFIIVKITGGLK